MVKTKALLLIAAWFGAFFSSTGAYIYQPVTRGGDITLRCPVEATNPNCGTISWSKDGEIVENQTEITYTLYALEFEDSRNYSCNNCGNVEEFEVKVGERPSRPPLPVCRNSPNTTIWCFAPLSDVTLDRMCLHVYSISRFGSKRRIKRNCEPHNQQLNASIDLDYYIAYRYELEVIVRNDFGQSSSKGSYDLSQNVIPEKPLNITLETTGSISFEGSFELPNSWKTASYLEYKYQVTHDNNTKTLWDYSSNTRTVNFQFRLDEAPKPYSSVCVQVKIKFGYILSNSWSNYGDKSCNYTESAAPSRSPENFHVSTTDIQDGVYRNVIFTWSPPPEEHRNGVIEENLLVVEEVNQGCKPREISNENLTAHTTQFSISDTLKADRTYVAKLSAWTNKGGSPLAFLVLAPFSKGYCPEILEIERR
ncbi:hypothetical protein HOLleu_19912 [Holothuria leucospilota]|uniref:Fibronectin type-III domain-containing protein n=1 Tax=Holothuria leucospilota TaxID=206669 RepID=A0A9Q1C0S7_HOLLE|nr:hypothetical protein HOLleu_19912 [Holothuria leucospilota]